MAPELFGTENSDADGHPTYAADIYAFSMVCIEIFTGIVPFATIRNDTAVMVKASQGGRPDRPEQSVELGLTDSLWALLQECWDVEPETRPSAAVLLDRLRQIDPGVTALPLLRKLDPLSEEAIQLLRFALGSGEEFFFQLKDDDARLFIQILDQVSANCFPQILFS